MRLQYGGSRCLSPYLRCVSLGPLRLDVGLTVGGLWPCVLPWVGVRPPEAGGLVAPPSRALMPAEAMGQCLGGPARIWGGRDQLHIWVPTPL